MKILLVEDEINLGQTLRDYLECKGHDVVLAESCLQAKEYFKQFHPSILLLDIGLPDGSGFKLAKELRALRDNFIFLFLSADNDPERRVTGLEIGAHDFIGKPFALKELTLRLDRIWRDQRLLREFPEEICHGNLKIWFKRYQLEDANGKIHSLSYRETQILKLLYQRADQVVARDEIIDKVWEMNSYPTNRTVDNYIVKLRKWCETDQSIDICSVRGVGYKLVMGV